MVRRNVVLAALVAAVLGTPGISRAQSNQMPTSLPTTTVATGQFPTPPPTVPPSASNPAALAPSTTTVDGKHTKDKSDSVRIHGYWKIDVREPNGKLVSHTEFENALTTGDPNGLSGDFFLANVLAGNLVSSSTVSNVTTLSVGITTLQIGVNTSGLTPKTGATFSGDNNTVTVLPTGPCGGQGCLVPTTVALNPPNNQVTLSSTFPSTSADPFTITQVGTFVNVTTLKVSTAGFLGTTLGGTANSLTSRTLAAPPNCGTSSLGPCTVPVSPNQLVSVNVTLSFQ
jgi:hypothetical protein